MDYESFVGIGIDGVGRGRDEVVYRHAVAWAVDTWFLLDHLGGRSSWDGSGRWFKEMSAELFPYRESVWYHYSSSLKS